MQFFSSPREDVEGAALAASMRALTICREAATALPFDPAEHQRWCEEMASEAPIIKVRPGILLKVGSPESRGTYIKKHTTFLVSEERSNSQVRRRFSDFEWLHAVLKARYVGMLMPSLPEKSVMMSDALMQSRIRGLSRFLQLVTASPYTRHDPAVVNFLSKSDEMQWEASKKDTTVLENGGAGHMRWIRRLVTHEIPASAEHDILAFKRQVEQQEKMLSELSACTKRIAEKATAMSKDVTTLASLFSGWSVAETTAQDQHPDLLAVLSHSTTAVTNWNQTTRFVAGIYELTLHEGLKYMHQQTRDMKDLLQHREASLLAATQQPKATRASSTAASTVASAASNLAARFRASSDAAPVDPAQAQQRAQHTFEVLTRALLAEEMHRFRREGTLVLSDALGHFACAQVQLNKRTGAVWRDYIKAHVADPQALQLATQEILEEAVAKAGGASNNGPALANDVAHAF
ncbi:hypothetical protein PINS_up004950 [Pythium insidiosum]|nr:hypothetical protein PINS_up004950 [Pythium insidiosum]